MKNKKIGLISIIILIQTLFTSSLNAETYFSQSRMWRGVWWVKVVNQATELRLNQIIDSVAVGNRIALINKVLIRVHDLELTVQTRETRADTKLKKLAFLWEIRDILEYKLYILSNTSTNNSTTNLSSLSYSISLSQSLTSSVNTIITSNQPGKWYYVVLPSGSSSPTASQIKYWTDSYGNQVWIKWNVGLALWDNQLNITWLNQDTRYILYFVAEDNYSVLNYNVTNLSFQTTNSWSSSTQSIKLSLNSITNSSFNWVIDTNTAGKWYYIVIPNATASTPTPSQIRGWLDSSWHNVDYKWTLNLNAWINNFSVTWLNPNTWYKIFLIEDDYSWNITNNPIELAFNTNANYWNTTTNTFAINISSHQTTTTSISSIINTNQSGKWYYIILPGGSSSPTASQIKSWTDSYWNYAQIKWNMNLVAWDNQLNIVWLTQGINYILYYSYEDNFGSLNSNILNLPFKTSINTTTQGQTINMVINPTSSTINWTINTNISGRWYYIILPGGSPAPSSTQIKAWLDSYSNTVSKKWNIYLYTWDNQLNITWLNSETSYILYFTAIDLNRNIQPNPISIPFITR